MIITKDSQVTPMADLDTELNVKPHTPSSLNFNSKKKELLTTALKRTSEWIFSQEIPIDVTIDVGGVSFSLHKFPLVSKCGLIRKLVSEGNNDGEGEVSFIELPDVPGGAEAFELAAKFCYGINFEIGTENIAMLRCAAEHLEMTEEFAVNNLVGRTDSYLNEVALKSLAGAVAILRVSSENFLPVAEKVKLVGRCIDAIAYIACRESQFCVSGGGGRNGESVVGSPRTVVDWWAEDLTVLRIDMFQRVLVAMMARGFKQYALGPILMLYAQKSLRGLEIFGKGRKNMEARQEHEKRVVLETIVSLLPREKNGMSVSFLSMLLRSAIFLETTVACRLDLEKRMGSQLAQAVLDDLLIPSYSFTGDTLFDVDTVQRVLANFLDLDSVAADRAMFGGGGGGGDGGDHVSPLQGELERVGRLLENYLAEVASDRNLSVSKFVGLAELLPEQSRVTEDGMYRAIDIYLKAHPVLSDTERKKVCSLMDCQKLSREACAHAAQNDRLPVQTVVQVLYYEQQRLRDAVSGGSGDSPSVTSSKPGGGLYNPSNGDAPNELSTLRQENEVLKSELVKMKMKMKDIEQRSSSTTTTTAAALKPSFSVSNSPQVNAVVSAQKPPHPRKSFMSSVSKTLSKLVGTELALSPFHKARTKPSKDRRHSIS